MFPGMRVLWSGTGRQSVASDSPSRVITLPALPAHTPWRKMGGIKEENKRVHKAQVFLLHLSEDAFDITCN